MLRQCGGLTATEWRVTNKLQICLMIYVDAPVLRVSNKDAISRDNAVKQGVNYTGKMRHMMLDLQHYCTTNLDIGCMRRP